MKRRGLRRTLCVLMCCLASAPLMANDHSYTTASVTDDALPTFYPQLKQQLTYPDSWLSGRYAHFGEWRQHARQVVRSLLLTPDSHRAFEPQVVDSQDRDTYVAQKVAFNLTDESRVPGLLLTPKTPGPHPAVLLLHDHGAKFDIGKEKMIRPWGDDTRLASANAWADRYFTGRFVGDELAKRGYVVLAVDALGWGDRGPLKYEQQQALASNFFNLGRSLAGSLAYEDMRSLDFLASLRSVDPKRVGVVGFSMGAYRAWQLAALSDKAAATAAISWIGTYDGLMVPGNNVLRGQSSFYMLHPGLSARLDFPDVASIAAPRPMLFFNGGKDTLFPQQAVQAAYDRMHQVWQSQHADERLETRIWPELGHVFYQEQQEAVFQWLDRWLASPPGNAAR
ncbi:alpha/beta fold hydrolase [Dickeya fangzhongdai]|uniref:dienelactone hydrolase family protein n=1 Tax=Dickeya fangzhongdai TaxID=1778540 RepID=UPI001ADC31FA|nr:alpha/beta fold hydrolase [Dickeya fangzhongdai]